MSLRTKIALTLFSAVVLFAGVDLFLRQAGFAKRFDGLERTRALEQFERFERELEAFQWRLADLAGTPRVSSDPGPDEQATADPENLGGALDGEFGAHFAAVYDGSGRLLSFDTRAEEGGREVFDGELDALGQVALVQGRPGLSGHPMREALDGKGRAVGLLSTKAGVALLGAARVPGRDGAPRFSFRGMLLEPALVANLQDVSFTRTKLLPALSAEPAIQERVEALVDTEGIQLSSISGGMHRVSTLLRDVKGAPVLLAELELPLELQRALGGLWSDLRRDSLFSALALALLFPLVILMLLQAIVTGPLTRLTHHAAAIGSSDDTELRLGLVRKDEIGQLASEFDNMLEKLSASRAQVVRTARVAGIAEISAGVMHNIGNALNSVHVSAALVRERIREVRPERLGVVLEQLEQQRGRLDEFLSSDPKGERLLALFRGLVGQADAGVEAARAEIGELVSGVERIGAMVASLQATHERQELVERVQLCRLVDEAIELCAQATGRVDVEVRRDYEVDPRMELDGHKLSQALCHVLHNAFQFLDPEREGDIYVRVARADDGGIELEVRDNGRGIEADRLGTIFQARQGTDQDSTGLGLHLAASSLSELGGRISADSDGPGTGARFRLRLPEGAERAAA